MNAQLYELKVIDNDIVLYRKDKKMTKDKTPENNKEIISLKDYINSEIDRKHYSFADCVDNKIGKKSMKYFKTFKMDLTEQDEWNKLQLIKLIEDKVWK